jgi:hypothetical protein
MLRLRLRRQLYQSRPGRRRSSLWVYAITIAYLALKANDPTLLVCWVHQRTRRLPLFGHRRVFKQLMVLLRYIYTEMHAWLGVRGIR